MLPRPMLAAILVIGIAGSYARAQSAGELLQRGIYTQETVGDLDGAIKIYRQILNAATESRAVAAQAQYRLGLCLFGKGDSADAAQMFQKLIKEYPEQKDLVAKARQKLPRASLLPVPWTDHEYAEYRFLLNGHSVPVTYSVEPSPNSASGIILLVRYPSFLSKTEVDRETLAPISSWNKTDSRTIRTEYRNGFARQTVTGKPPHNVPVGNGVYDDYAISFVLRRLPLAEGYKASIPVMDDEAVDTQETKVEALEDIEVPAGRFHCFKVTLHEPDDPPMTNWISTDASRTLVQVSFGTIDFELMHLDPNGPQPTKYEPKIPGVTFTAAAGWLVGKPQDVDDGTRVDLSDPEGQTTSASVFYRREKMEPSKIDAYLRGRQFAGEPGMSDYKVRPGSIERFPFDGYEAQRAVADYIDKNKQPKLQWMTWVHTENFFASVAAKGIDPADLDRFVQRFQPIVDSLVIP